MLAHKPLNQEESALQPIERGARTPTSNWGTVRTEVPGEPENMMLGSTPQYLSVRASF